MSVPFAQRMETIGTETAFEVLAKARGLEAQGRNIVHLEIGEPDFPTPPNIVEAAERAIRDGFTHYTPAGGLMPARQAVADWIRRWYEVEVTPQQVVMVPGSKNVILFTALALVDQGTEVILPDPGYPIYESLVRLAGGTPVPIALRERNQFRLDIEELRSKITPRTRLIIINSPHNPTGGVLSSRDLEQIGALALEHDLYVLSDEVYGQITYDAHHASILTVPGMLDRTIYSDGLSKAYSMCGWRLGFAVAPLEIAKRMETLMINTSSCAAAFTQMAAIEALSSPQSDRAVEGMVAEFKRRRDVIVDLLNAMPGVTCHRPLGAFYVFPNITGTGINERVLADRLLYEGGVAALPGTSFGDEGKGYLRFSYANAVPQIEEAMKRMKGVLEGAKAHV
ncbi:MAG TPA: pyridoxal phosphate-dependent aminotransferase [Candidatus Limnocylindrales bacterium]|nr:pyridoxal phosphate-dependent aminotransferase [Candidatus Limnocylindrales bacterium]